MGIDLFPKMAAASLWFPHRPELAFPPSVEKAPRPQNMFYHFVRNITYIVRSQSDMPKAYITCILVTNLASHWVSQVSIPQHAPPHWVTQNRLIPRNSPVVRYLLACLCDSLPLWYSFIRQPAKGLGLGHRTLLLNDDGSCSGLYAELVKYLLDLCHCVRVWQMLDFSFPLYAGCQTVFHLVNHILTFPGGFEGNLSLLGK